MISDSFQLLADAIATIPNFDERKRLARSIGILCNNRRNFDWSLWNKICRVSEPETKIDELRERVDAVKQEEKNMVIWVRGGVVKANCDQRAIVLGVDVDIIHIRLLGNNDEYNIKPHCIIGFEIGKGLTIKFDYKGHHYKG